MSTADRLREFPWKHVALLGVVGGLLAALGLFVHLRSYSRSDVLTVCDVTLTADEGLISLQLPLTRVAAAESPVTEFLIYTREQTGWACGLGGKCPLRVWMATLDEARCEGGMCAGFGYWKGGWQSPSRPGPFVVLFAPVWAVACGAFGVYLAFYFRLIRFRLRTLLIATTVCAGLLWLVILRAPG